MSNMDGVFQVEMSCKGGQIIGVMVHIVSVGGLGGATVTTAVMGDHAIAVLQEEQHLRIPVIGRQRPAMAEHDGLARTPVLVEDLNTVFSSNCAHRNVSWMVR